MSYENITVIVFKGRMALLRGAFMAGIKLELKIWQFLNGKYFPRLLSPWLEGLCQVPQCQKGSGYSPSGLTCILTILLNM